MLVRANSSYKITNPDTQKFRKVATKKEVETKTMSWLISASPPTTSAAISSQQSKAPFRCFSYRLDSVVVPRIRSQPPNPGLALTTNRTSNICCAGPGFPGSGEDESKGVLDAFFLGKALGEALTERIESTVGEFLSIIGRLQAEQQKQVQEFQEEVLERAKRAKEQAAREAMESRGLIPSSTGLDTKAVSNGATSTNAPTPSSSSATGLEVADGADPESSNKGTVIGVTNED